MTLNLSLPNNPHEIKPRITVIGVGGAGGNAVSNMIRSNLEGVEFIIANTDAQALAQSQCARRIQLGHGITQGLGAGSRPDIGRAAAEESIDSVIEELAGSNMVFITAGMGGGTGTGAAPVVARAAREHGILTVGVVTKPFHFEGLHRMRLADSGIQELQQYVDTLIIIPNQNLFRIATEKTTFADAFAMADQVLYSGVRGVTDLMVMPGLINLDFADIRSVMTEMGKAMMGTGEAEGEGRAVTAAERAISNPLLDDVSMKGARGVLINITGGPDMTLFEVDEAATRIREEVDPEANIIFGSTFDQNLTGKIRISVVATGIEAAGQVMPRPVSLSLVAAGGRVVSTPAHQPAEAPPVLRAERREMEVPAAVMSAQPATAGALAMAMETQPAMQVPKPVPPMTMPVMTAPAAQPQTDAGMSLAFDLAGTAAPTVASPAPTMAAPAPTMAPAPQMPAPRPAEERPFIAPAPVERAAAPAPRPAMPPMTPSMPSPTMTPPAMTAPAAQTMAASAARSGAASAAPEAPRRGTNLFARVTGTGGLFGRAPKVDAAMSPTPVAAPAAPAPAPAPRLQAPAMPAQPVVQPRPAATQPAAAGDAQQRLSGLDPKDRIAPTRAEEEFFEIPAFLRRQAN
ncbi:MAG TPA: cell division protein FtsZ [Hypericibacter adhaerens]|uniref:cell division protein FtsZ n=1 Tax=Hypericibacter adhaerens TaxID=2602016 RepID=UPI002CD7279B|nr:cell division protein FtsZ [Hypericibacter adhaerens]HWA43411.1 cell division protein FtsZ [Hypericibacter adhaerens]